MAQKKKNNPKDDEFKDGYTVLAGSSTPSRKLKEDPPKEKAKANKRLITRNFFLIFTILFLKNEINTNTSYNTNYNFYNQHF